MIYTAILTAALLAASPEGATSAAESYIETENYIVTGTFAGYIRVDYYHAVILLPDGIMEYLWAPRGDTPGLDVFLFDHRWELIDVTVENKPNDIREAGDPFLPTIIDASGGGENYTEWYAEAAEELGLETQEDFNNHFGSPADTQELFDAWAYANGEE